MERYDWIACVFIYCVHVNALKHPPEAGTCSAQQQVAVQMILTFWGLLMRPVINHLGSLEDYLKGGSIEPKVSRVIPALNIVSTWMSTPFVKDVYAGMPSLESIRTPLVQLETWSMFAKLANELNRLVTSGVMGLQSTSSSPRKDSGDLTEVVLPETVFTSSFCNVFSSDPQSVFLLNTNCNALKSANSNLLALHARLSNILSAAEFLDGSGLRCFQYDSALNCFVCPDEISADEESTTPKVNSTQEIKFMESELAALQVEGEVISDLERKKRENQLREKMRDAHISKPIFEIKAEFLIPDTNTFIDHLSSLQKLIDSKRFTTLVPTTVIAELTGLSQPAASNPLSRAGSVDPEHDDWVSDQAKLAVAYLRNVSESRTPGIYTVTSNGNRQPTLNFVTEEAPRGEDRKAVNDDLILSCCVQFESKLGTANAQEDGEEILRRRVVLLTEDRALNIKAIAAQVPCRTVPNFVKWSQS
ncbi:hypothetical protein L596_019111 [Steinernema carpocapsae]|uniref:PIN domain-containing protein n=1 Tax=Steinernema carpocapsae TaxID=34508 RepID=A0A4U5N7E0_STECR|nr:hypothetical protein L596_019111 [Steinernema carpocapsae]